MKVRDVSICNACNAFNVCNVMQCRCVCNVCTHVCVHVCMYVRILVMHACMQCNKRMHTMHVCKNACM